MLSALAANMQGNYSVWLLLVSLGSFGVFYFAYYGVQSLFQARILKTPLPPDKVRPFMGHVVAVTGRAQRIKLEGDRDFDNTVWVRTTFYERQMVIPQGRRSNYGPRWVTRKQSGNTRRFDFYLLGEKQGKVRVENRPTEIHGTQTSTGFSGSLLNDVSGRRRVHHIIPANATLTVIGRLDVSPEGYPMLIQDPKLGMLLTTKDPDTQREEEAFKGWLSVIIVPLIWLLISAWLHSRWNL